MKLVNSLDWQCEIAVLIRELRIKRGFSSAEKFAFSHDLCRTMYQKWESGSNMELRTLLKLCEIHQINLCDFFRLIDDKRNGRVNRQVVNTA